MSVASLQDRVGFGILGGLSIAGLGGCTALLLLVVVRGAGAVHLADSLLLAAMMGTAALVCGTALVAILPGVLVAAWLADPTGQASIRRAVRLCCRGWAGLPPVLPGVAAMVVAGRWMGWGSGFVVGVVALGLAALPRVVCAAEARLREVPADVREAALALGAGRWRAMLDGVIPAAAPGLGASLGRVLARTAGETAPLVIAWGGLALSGAEHRGPDSPLALPYHLFTLALQHAGGRHGAVDAAALLLLTVTVLLGVLPAALLQRREERKLW